MELASIMESNLEIVKTQILLPMALNSTRDKKLPFGLGSVQQLSSSHMMSCYRMDTATTQKGAASRLKFICVITKSTKIVSATNLLLPLSLTMFISLCIRFRNKQNSVTRRITARTQSFAKTTTCLSFRFPHEDTLTTTISSSSMRSRPKTTGGISGQMLKDSSSSRLLAHPPGVPMLHTTLLTACVSTMRLNSRRST